MNTGPTPLDVALRLLECGVSVLPLRLDGSKAPAVSTWDGTSDKRMDVDTAREVFGGNVGIGIIAGRASGNLEIIDIEGRAPVAEIIELIRESSADLLSKLVQVRTPSGGIHLFYRCDTIGRNQKLAMAVIDGAPKTLIETRAQGGYVATISSPPSIHELNKPYELISGKLSEIPTISDFEREIVITCCRSFNTYIRDESRPQQQLSAPTGTGRPGDDYNLRGDPLAVLLSHGWKISHSHGETVYLRRPGKDTVGISATYGHVAPRVLYVFSSNAAPFDMERGYDPFGVYSVLEHGGDVAAAAKALAGLGYGENKLERLKKDRPKTELIPRENQAQPSHLNTYTLDAKILDLPDVTPDGAGLPQQAEQSVAAPTAPPLERLPDGQSVQALAQLTKPTEDRVATLYQTVFKDQARYCKEWGTWLEWEAAYWNTERTDLALDRARVLARMVNLEDSKSTAKAGFARGVETLAKASRTFATRPDQWDQDHRSLNTPAGTIDLYTGEIRPCTPADYITKICRVEPAAGPHPIFDRFMLDICLEDKSLVSYHQRALGSMLSGALTDHWIIFWIGAGRNGKNTLGDFMVWLMGSYAKVISSETLLSSMSGSKHPTDLASLRGIRLAVSSEVPEGAHWDEARIKNVTGDDEISARFMGRDFFTFKRTHKHLVFGNSRPMLRVVDDAIKARLHIVPFNAKFTDDACDPDMAAKLRTEAPQILQWLIDGHALWLEDGTLRQCSAVASETDQYFRDQSTPEMWVEECCLTGAEQQYSECPAADLYASFRAWKLDRGEKAFSKTRWGQWMTPRFSKHLNNGVIYESIRLNPSTQPLLPHRTYSEDN